MNEESTAHRTRLRDLADEYNDLTARRQAAWERFITASQGYVQDADAVAIEDTGIDALDSEITRVRKDIADTAKRVRELEGSQ